MPSLGGPFPALADHLLEKLDLGRVPLALIDQGSNIDPLRPFLDELEVLLGVESVIARLGDQSAEEIFGAGLVILAGEHPEAWLQELGRDETGPVLMQSLNEDGVIMAAGMASAVMGSWHLPPEGIETVDGLGWLPGALVLPGVPEPADSSEVRNLLNTRENSYALGLPEGTALAIGPGGSIEVWSREAPKVTMGKVWTAE